MASTEVLEWRQARQWLINSGVIPPTHRVTKPDVDLVDFARSLRDGVFLCSLVNTLKSNCVEDWAQRPLMQVGGQAGGQEGEGKKADLIWLEKGAAQLVAYVDRTVECSLLRTCDLRSA